MGSREERGGVAAGGPKRGPGGRVPLFDRLFDLDRSHQEAQPRRVLARREVLASIRAELARLLNTRCAGPIDGLGDQERTVVNFGLPDFLTLSPTTDRDRQRLARLITDAVRAYEPRLRAPVVEVAPLAGRAPRLQLTLHATLELDHLAEPVSFPLAIDERGGAIVVGAEDGGV